MIDKTHLRLGNYVMDEDSVVMITELTSKHANHSQAFNCPYDDLEPIPLTPEILEKCGFEKNEDGDDGYYYDLSANGILFIEGDKKGYCEVFLDMIEEVRVRYLHQLQNLYFSLTGQELNVKN